MRFLEKNSGSPIATHRMRSRIRFSKSLVELPYQRFGSSLNALEHSNSLTLFGIIALLSFIVDQIVCGSLSFLH